MDDTVTTDNECLSGNQSTIIKTTSKAKDKTRRKIRYSSEKIAKFIEAEKMKIPENHHAQLIIKALKKSNLFSQVKENISTTVHPRGIVRTSDITINTVWCFWKNNATISNARTSRLLFRLKK